MNERNELDRRLAGWMTEAASSPAPAAALDKALEATARRRPRPRWLAWFGSDWVGTAAPGRVGWAWPGPRLGLPMFALVALLVAAAIVSTLLVGAELLRRDSNPLPKPASNGRIAFAADEDGRGDPDIYLVGQDGGTRRIVGTDSDGLDQVCPAFSADATRFAYSQAQMTSLNQTWDASYRDGALVIADIDADGNVSNARTIPVGGTVPPSCPVWSPDGQWIAFIVPSAPASGGDVWIVESNTGKISVVPDVWASDLGWAPDGSRLAIASGDRLAPPGIRGGPLLLYSVASGEVVPLPGASGVTALDWSPDGRRIVYQRLRALVTLVDGGIVAGTDSQEIWTVAPDGRDRTLQTPPFGVNHGLGPVWSPAGERIVYQRICATRPPDPGESSTICRENHDVVLLTPGMTVSETTPAGSEVVLPFARVDQADGPAILWPFEVSWSPDGHKLLYAAWGGPIAPGLDRSLTKLAVVDVGASSPPILLHEAGGIEVTAPGQLPVRTSSWGRLPGGITGQVMSVRRSGLTSVSGMAP